MRLQLSNTRHVPQCQARRHRVSRHFLYTTPIYCKHYVNRYIGRRTRKRHFKRGFNLCGFRTVSTLQGLHHLEMPNFPYSVPEKLIVGQELLKWVKQGVVRALPYSRELLAGRCILPYLLEPQKPRLW